MERIDEGRRRARRGLDGDAAAPSCPARPELDDGGYRRPRRLRGRRPRLRLRRGGRSPLVPAWATWRGRASARPCSWPGRRRCSTSSRASSARRWWSWDPRQRGRWRATTSSTKFVTASTVYARHAALAWAILTDGQRHPIRRPGHLDCRLLSGVTRKPGWPRLSAGAWRPRRRSGVLRVRDPTSRTRRRAVPLQRRRWTAASDATTRSSVGTDPRPVRHGLQQVPPRWRHSHGDHARGLSRVAVRTATSDDSPQARWARRSASSTTRCARPP